MPWEMDGGAVVTYYQLQKMNMLSPRDEHWAVPKVYEELSPQSLPWVNIPIHAETDHIPELMHKVDTPLLNMFHIGHAEFEKIIDPVHDIGGKILLWQTIHWPDDTILQSNRLEDIDVIVTPTEFAKRVFNVVRRIPLEKMVTIPHGVDLQKFYKRPTILRQKLGIKSHQKVILYSGRLSLWKGVHAIPSLIRPIVKDYDSVFIIRGGSFAGNPEGMALHQLFQKIANNNPNVIFIPEWQPPEFMEELYSMVDILLFNCHDKETRALTDSGLKFVSEITLKDKVWSLNKSGKMELCSIKNIFVDHYGGEMFRIKNKQVSLFVTPDHRILYTTRKKRDKIQIRKAKDLKKSRYYLPTTGVWEGRNDDYINTKELVDIDLLHTATKLPEKLCIDSLLRLLGWYISEGMMTKGTNCVNVNVMTLFNSNEDNLGEIYELAKNLGLHAGIYEEYAIINSVELCELFSSAGKGAKNKTIPEWALQFSRRLLTGLYESMIKGDGSRGGNYSAVYYTSSDDLLEKFVELVLKVGYSPYYYRRKTEEKWSGDKFFPAAESWAISIREKNNKGTVKPEAITKVNYEGMIWCLETENGNFFTERDGLIVCSGNSGHEGFGVPLIEAQAVKAIPITTAINNHVEILGMNGDAGLLVEPKQKIGVVNDGTPIRVATSEQLIGPLRWLHDNPDEMRIMGERGRRNVEERFDLTNIAAQWLQLYDTLVPEGYDMNTAMTERILL